MTSVPPSPGAGNAAQARRPENLALTFQELLTAVVRLRSNRQPVSDAELFRQQARAAIRQADQEGKRLGYTEEDTRAAIFAVVAFLDETVLNQGSPVFRDWARKPLQEELFGRHTAGEIFFDQLQALLGRRDTPELADLLEVYQLCLLLGFVGKYSITGRGELKAITDAVAEKMRRIRLNKTEIAPHWRLPELRLEQRTVDPLVRSLSFVAGGVGVLALVLFIVYKLMLRSGLHGLESLATPFLK